MQRLTKNQLKVIIGFLKESKPFQGNADGFCLKENRKQSLFMREKQEMWMF